MIVTGGRAIIREDAGRDEWMRTDAYRGVSRIDICARPDLHDLPAFACKHPATFSDVPLRFQMPMCADCKRRFRARKHVTVKTDSAAWGASRANTITDARNAGGHSTASSSAAR